MFDQVQPFLSEKLKDFRAGVASLTWFAPSLESLAPTIMMHSRAIDGEGRLDRRYTADGPGISPPLVWGVVPERAESLALLVEDADSPTVKPVVHAIVLDLPPAPGMLQEGEMPVGEMSDWAPQMGLNSLLRRRYLPPNPPVGHGVHHYVFQLYALDTVLPHDFHPGRSALIHAMEGHVVGRGVLIAQFSR